MPARAILTIFAIPPRSFGDVEKLNGDWAMLRLVIDGPGGAHVLFL
jgi:hypothetical protein